MRFAGLSGGGPGAPGLAAKKGRAGRLEKEPVGQPQAAGFCGVKMDVAGRGAFALQAGLVIVFDVGGFAVEEVIGVELDLLAFVDFVGCAGVDGGRGG